MSNTTAAVTKVIIDADVGSDDMIGLLFAMAALPATMQVLAITTVWGNANVENVMRNVVAMFYVLWREMGWREDNGYDVGFEAFQAYQPTVSIGSGHALGEPVKLKAGGHHGVDGLHNFHELYPDFSPDNSWKSLFDSRVPKPESEPEYYNYFNTTTSPGHKEILRVLAEEPADTVTVIAVGPLTNIALAAAEDPETFLRAKELLVMGGAVNVEGNVSPVAEANTWNDAVACARTYALSSMDPSSTMPETDFNKIQLGAYPPRLPKQLNATIFPLDITLSHCVDYERFAEVVEPLIEAGSPLAALVHTFIKGIHVNSEEDCVILHDPLTVWYALDKSLWEVEGPKDIRIEALGQFTRGMHVTYELNKTEGANEPLKPLTGQGNRIYQAVKSPGQQAFHDKVMDLFATP